MSGTLPREAVVVERLEESPEIFTLRLEYLDEGHRKAFEFEPGQFNMVYLHGVGEVPMSIVSDPADAHCFDHSIRALGRVTEGLAGLKAGDRLGIRGPFGRGWPLAEAEGRDLVIVTGGLGCAPALSLINYVMRRRERFGQVSLLQGVRHPHDLIWRERYDAWARQPDTQVLLAADLPKGDAQFHEGPVVELCSQVRLVPGRSTAMLCGPELMVMTAIAQLRELGLGDGDLWLGLERNMACGNGLCGHCQIGPLRVCKEGPVFRYAEIADYFGVKGF